MPNSSSPTERKSRSALASGLSLSLLVALSIGCASVETTRIERLAPKSVPPPNRILVYDVAMTLDDVPADSSMRAHVEARDEKPSEEDLELGRELGSQIAKKIVEELAALGLAAKRAQGFGAEERLDDVVVRSEFVEIEQGSRTMRVLIGFGAGSNDLATHFEVYQVTSSGRTPFGSAQIEAEGGHMPGMLLSMGIGGLIKGAAIGGALATGREFTSESIQGAADRTAKEFIEIVKPGLEEHGWIEKE